MQALARSLALCFAAGAVGALASGVALWIAGRAGLVAALGVSIAPELTPAWLYPRLVWGGLFGLLLALPLTFRGAGVRGLAVSLAPTLAQLLYFFPRAGRGVLGLELGAATPLVVALANAVWGLVASAWLRWTDR